jgi:hypothetical protein
MQLLSSTSNFKRIIRSLLILIILIAAFDRTLFKILFPFYDTIHHLSNITRPNKIFVVGSSHVEYAINAQTLQREMGVPTDIFHLSAASLQTRLIAIKERLSQTGLPDPEMIVLETSKEFLNPRRYDDRFLIHYLPYLHKGILQGYFAGVSSERIPDIFWRKLSWSYSLSTEFERTTNLGRIKALALNLFGITQSKTEQPDGDPRFVGLDDKDKPDAWWRAKQAEGLTQEMPVDQVALFKEIVTLVRSRGIKLVLLETPSYKFQNRTAEDSYSGAKKLLADTAKNTPGVFHLKIDVPNEVGLFTNEAHLSPAGRQYYTPRLIKALTLLLKS